MDRGGYTDTGDPEFQVMEMSKMDEIGPYLNMKEAACFCDYATATFKRMIKEYRIKRYGPRLNRFAIRDLETWMQDPAGLAKNPKPTPARTPKPLEVKP